MQTLIKNIGQLVTMAPLAAEQRGNKVCQEDLGILNDAWLLIDGGKVHSFGGMDVCPSSIEKVVDAKGQLLMPGLIDSHTHPIFAGSRHKEFAMRLDGKTYQEIAEEGGGISATVKFTKEAK